MMVWNRNVIKKCPMVNRWPHAHITYVDLRSIATSVIREGGSEMMVTRRTDLR